MKALLLIFSLLALVSCKDRKQQNFPAENVELSAPDAGIGKDSAFSKTPFASDIEEAHNIEEFKNHKAVSFNIALSSAGQEPLQAKVTSLTNSTKIRIDKKDGTLVVFDGNDVFICPANAEDKGSRLNMFTWQYFFFLPFRLNDPGTQWQQIGPQKTENSIFNTGKLTFTGHTRNVPANWFLLYQDPESQLLHAVAYSSGYQETGAQNPKAIVYKDYKVVDGVPFATTWEFHNWSKQNGIGKKTGEAKISNILFFPARNNLFKKQENSRIIK
ncbi:MAG: hypothetical protein WCD31_04435 [Gillisia sp.]